MSRGGNDKERKRRKEREREKIFHGHRCVAFLWHFSLVSLVLAHEFACSLNCLYLLSLPLYLPSSAPFPSRRPTLTPLLPLTLNLKPAFRTRVYPKPRHSNSEEGPAPGEQRYGRHSHSKMQKRVPQLALHLNFLTFKNMNRGKAVCPVLFLFAVLPFLTGMCAQVFPISIFLLYVGLCSFTLEMSPVRPHPNLFLAY